MVSTAKEYRGFGFGTLLGKLFRERHPDKDTGGTTYAGSKQVKRIWDNFVREAMASGMYTQLVKQGKITKDRVKEIVKDLDERKTKSNEPSENALDINNASKQ